MSVSRVNTNDIIGGTRYQVRYLLADLIQGQANPSNAHIHTCILNCTPQSHETVFGTAREATYQGHFTFCEIPPPTHLTLIFFSLGSDVESKTDRMCQILWLAEPEFLPLIILPLT